METGTRPAVSIVTPVYKAKEFIVNTMDSVRSQSFEDWELLLVDDASPDDSAEVIETYLKRTGDTRIRLIRMPENSGAATARNLAVEQARGRYIAYMDADDLWESQKLTRQIAFMKEKQAAFSFTGYEFADEEGRGMGIIVRVPETLNYKQALKNTTIFTSTVMFDTDRISKDKLVMPLIKSEDTALWWSILRGGYIAYGLNENLVRYRRSASTLSSDKIEAVRRIWNLYRYEGLSIPASAWNFCFWGFRAVMRRL